MNRCIRLVALASILIFQVSISGSTREAQGQDNRQPPQATTSQQQQEAVAKPGQQAPEGIMKITEVEGISEYALENGTRVLLFPDPSKEVVTVNMTVFVGSRHEGYGEAGMAHLLEHMLFKGTPEHPKIPKVLQERGATFNGTTWVDRTNYYETLPASEDNLKFALNLEADRLINSFIRGEDLESEMTVVRNEFERSENSPFRVLMQRMQSIAYDWHNYGQSTIGNRSDIERVPVVSLRRFYKKYYRPDNVMVIIAGKFDSETALQLVSESFGKLESPETPIDPTYTVEPPKDGERTVALRRVGDVQYVGTTYHVPAGGHPEFAAIKALSSILGNEPSGRLYRDMVSTKLASSVSSFAFAYAEPGNLMCFAEIPNGNSIESARAKLIEVQEQSFLTTPVTEAEVERAKQNILKQRELQANKTDQLAIQLSEWSAQGDWRLYFLYRDWVEALTAEQVQAVAIKYLVRNNRTVGLFLPADQAERVQIPETPNLQAMLKDYKGRQVVQSGEVFDPDPIKIEARTKRGELPSGLRFAMLPKQSRGQSVSLSMTLRFGDQKSMINRLGAVELLGILMARGTEDKSYEQLKDELTRLRATMQVSTFPGVLQVSLETKKEYLAEVLELLGEVLRTPALKSEELEILREQIITQIQQSATEPTALAPRNVRRRLSPYGSDDVRYVQTLDEEIAMYRSATREQIVALHDELLSGQVGELSVVGDFDQQAVMDAINASLEGWTTDTPYVRIDRPANGLEAGKLESVQTPDKENAFFFASQEMSLSDSSPEFAPLELANFILGGGGLSSRLANRVRQQEGLSYTVRSSLSNRAKDKRVDWTVYAITNPDNKDKLISVIQEEMDKFRDKGIEQTELEQAQSAYLQAKRVGRTSDAALASELLQGLFLGRTMKFAAEHEQRIAETTVDQVNSAIKKHLHWNKSAKAIAGDFSK